MCDRKLPATIAWLEAEGLKGQFTLPQIQNALSLKENLDYPFNVALVAYLACNESVDAAAMMLMEQYDEVQRQLELAKQNANVVAANPAVPGPHELAVIEAEKFEEKIVAC